MKAQRWWKRLPRLVRGLAIAALAILALGVVLGLVFGRPLFALAPVGWLTILFFAWLDHRSRAKIEAWERAKREHNSLDALEALHDWRTGREDDGPR